MTRKIPTCNVHRTPMEKRSIPIVYGFLKLSTMTGDYFQARNRLFPCCDDIAFGGCSVRSNKTRRRFICEQCCKTRNAWLDEHQPGWSPDEHSQRFGNDDEGRNERPS